MRRVQGIVGLSLFAWVCAAHVLGCFFSYDLDQADCDLYPHPGCVSGASSGSGGTPAGCVPSENKNPVDDICGVFVSSRLGEDGNAGMKSAPVKTLQHALEKANGRPVYACAEEFAGSVMLASGSDIYGGLDCSKGWAYIGAMKKSTLIGQADKPALHLEQNASGVKVVDFTIQAADAMAAGGSSIAMLMNRATGVGLMRCDLVAGNGKVGTGGDTPTDPVGPTDPNAPGIKGNDGQKACTDMVQQFGGTPKENMLCPAASGRPLGGAGGIGFVASGGDGQDGIPGMAGQHGIGQPVSDPMNTWACVAGSGLGNGGSNGALGTTGDSAKGNAALGTIDSKGYTGVAGQSGGAGKPGQGGGGGGGAKGKLSCAGASGGGGGAGGCGGNGGTGGKAGGASIGIISLNAALTFDTVTIRVGAAGNGGDGGDGQGGGIGGKGGTGGVGATNAPATLAACDGGKGGQGGTGGKGGGGRGGHAIGIAYTGKSMPSTEGVTFMRGTPGAGGKGTDAMHDGDPGVQADVQVFP